jgi:carnitine O-acetyltransferase
LTQTEPISARTFANERRLPRLPLPTLEESCQRFLAWCAPLLDAEELTATEEAVASYLRPESAAHALQAALEHYDQSLETGSWLDEFWSSRYLGRRDRIALNANYFCLLPASGQPQHQRAASVIAAALNYKLLLGDERVPPDVDRGQPLSMVQNRHLFSTTRIPGLEQDTVRSPYSADWPGPPQERHVVVFCDGNLFQLDVIGPSGRPHSLDDLTTGLEVIQAQARRAGRGQSVGHLTTEPRAEWAASRQALITSSPHNQQVLDLIERALFCVSLEQVGPADAHQACDQLLHGDSANRWFDKALSFIVFADGTAGINVEHSSLDGITISRLADALLAQPAEEHSHQSGAHRQGPPRLAAHEFALDATRQAEIRAAALSFACHAAGTATQTLSFPDFGRQAAKALGISPDAFAQMAFQVAHHRARGYIGATYESIATRQFQHGRTEAMRVVTPESVRFVDLMNDPKADSGIRRAALRTAADSHVRRAKECQQGQAPEQHLWELQLIQKRHGQALGARQPLALYDSPGWHKMRDDCLSTSATSSQNIALAGFGPTGARCIGISYMLDERFSLYLSAPANIAHDLHRFAEELKKSVPELQHLLRSQRRRTGSCRG